MNRRTSPTAREPAWGWDGFAALRWLTSIGAALICGIWVFDVTARAAQWESRLMEMARPACRHGMSNEELRRLVSHEFQAGSSKKDALHAIVSLCQANT
jgi:hypothetical protein